MLSKELFKQSAPPPPSRASFDKKNQQHIVFLLPHPYTKLFDYNELLFNIKMSFYQLRYI